MVEASVRKKLMNVCQVIKSKQSHTIEVWLRWIEYVRESEKRKQSGEENRERKRRITSICGDKLSCRFKLHHITYTMQSMTVAEKDTFFFTRVSSMFCLCKVILLIMYWVSPYFCIHPLILFLPGYHNTVVISGRLWLQRHKARKLHLLVSSGKIYLHCLMHSWRTLCLWILMYSN